MRKHAIMIHYKFHSNWLDSFSETVNTNFAENNKNNNKNNKNNKRQERRNFVTQMRHEGRT